MISVILRFLVLVVGAAILFLGGLVSINPDGAIQLLEWGIRADDRVAKSVVRGDLGGAMAAIGAFILFGAVRESTTWLYAGAFMLSAVFLGKTIGLSLDGPHPDVLSSLATEAIAIVLLVAYCQRINYNP